MLRQHIETGSGKHLEGRGLDSSSQQSRTHPSHPFARQQIVGPLLRKNGSANVEYKHNMRTWVPSLPFDLLEPNTKQVLIDIENGWDNDGHREIFLHE
jgi:hypothetical protein